MAYEKYILVSHFSKRANIEDNFLQKLHEYGLLSFQKMEDDVFIDEEDISEIEKMFRLHKDLGINYEGLDAIRQMLGRMQSLEDEMNEMRRRLRFYE